MLSIVITILDTTRNNRSFDGKVRIIREYKYLQILINKITHRERERERHTHTHTHTQIE